MCNDYRLLVGAAAIAEDFEDLKIKIDYPDGVPNVAARSDIMITDSGVIVRSVGDVRGTGELVQRRWSWPGARGKPVYNFQSDNREFTSNRCLIVVDGFYEFTTAKNPKQKRKDKWLFTKRNEPIFCIAGIWRAHPEVGEAFTMLTMPPGPDIEPYHSRQVCVLDRSAWADWLDPRVSAKDILRPLPAGTLMVEQVVAPPPEPEPEPDAAAAGERILFDAGGAGG